MPGKQGSIKVSYNTSIVGSFRKVVIVTTDFGKKIILTIKGTVKGKQIIEELTYMYFLIK